MIDDANNKECVSDKKYLFTENRHCDMITAQQTQQYNYLHNQLSSSILYDMPIIQSVESLRDSHRNTGLKYNALLSPPIQEFTEMCPPLVGKSVISAIFQHENRPSVSMSTTNESHSPGESYMHSSSPDASVLENGEEPDIKGIFEFIAMPETTNGPGAEETSKINILPVTDSELHNCADLANLSKLKRFSLKLGNAKMRPQTTLSLELMPAPRFPAPCQPRHVPDEHAPIMSRILGRSISSQPASGCSPETGIIRSSGSSLTFRTRGNYIQPDNIDEATVDKSSKHEDVVIEPDFLANAQISQFQQISESERKEHCPATRHGPPLSCNFCWNTVDADGRTLRRKTKYHCPECNANLCIVPCFHQFHDMNERR